MARVMESFRYSSAMRLMYFFLFFITFNVLHSSLVFGDNKCNVFTRQTLDNICGENKLEVAYGENLECAKQIPLSAVSSQSAPKVTFKDADPDKSYSLLMIDPDAPNSGTNYWLHWIVVNIQGRDVINGNIEKSGKTLTEYNAPSPPGGSGVHRYQFFLIQQKHEIDSDGPKTRGQFNAVEFANNNSLCAPPRASFQFKTQRD